MSTLQHMVTGRPPLQLHPDKDYKKAAEASGSEGEDDFIFPYLDLLK